ncbi:phage terminase small subunit [Comamonadaceae bacterium PP-2]
MLSPFQRHRARMLAEQAASASPFGKEVHGSDYQLMQAKLAGDKRTLKQMHSVELKRRTKANVLPEYFPWIDGALAAGQGAQDSVLTTVMVWAIDAGAYALGIQIAAYVLKHKLLLPDQYNRSLATVLVDEFADAYLKGQWNALAVQVGQDGAKTLVTMDDPQALTTLAAVADLTDAEDVPDQARAKLYKATAYAELGKVQTAESPDLEEFSAERLQAILARLQRALQLDAQSGVKKDIERIERKLAAASAGKVTLPDADAPPADAAAAAAAPVADTAAAAAKPTPKADVVNNKTAAKKTATATPKAATARAKPGRKPAAAK